MSAFNRPLGYQDTNFHVDPNLFSDEAFQGEYSGTNLIYKGFARPGSSVDEAVWQIAFLTYDGSNNVLMIQWPLELFDTPGIPQTQSVGTVTTPWTSFSGTLSPIPIVKGTLVMTVGALRFTDVNKNGTLTSTGLNSGTINYATGAITLTINPALVGDTAVSATFNIPSLGGASNDYQFVWSERHNYTYA